MYPRTKPVPRRERGEDMIGTKSALGEACKLRAVGDSLMGSMTRALLQNCDHDGGQSRCSSVVPERAYEELRAGNIVYASHTVSIIIPSRIYERLSADRYINQSLLHRYGSLKKRTSKQYCMHNINQSLPQVRQCSSRVDAAQE